MTKQNLTNRWTAAAANDWYRDRPWPVGCNYNPRTAINQLEMWQAGTFDPKTIGEGLGWAASIGMNSVRVFLHDLLWKQDSGGFVSRFEQFLTIADAHGISALPVFFDSCWHPSPHLGRQRDPEPGVHNSGWVQSPGVPILRDEKRFAALESYVTGFVKHFADDRRILAWDIWNEPDNDNNNSRPTRDIAGKGMLVAKLLPQVFAWARAGRPSQPLTSGIWLGDWCCETSMRPWERVQIEQSDIVSFHAYNNPDHFQAKCEQLQRYGRPILCTEYLARGGCSVFDTALPIMKKYKIGAFNWGLVQGKTQTHLPWDSWQRPYIDHEPSVWHHEVFHPDGRPYDQAEVELMRQLTGRGRA